ncbi:MAG TPA: hypothetical protein VKT28_12190 [Puia sp.]|nr:hypothetical protein [Puia sp.]
MSIFNDIEIVLCAFLLFFLVWKEIKRNDKRRLVIRLIVSVLSVINLACIILPITYKAENSNADKEAIILTEGYNKDSLELPAYKNIKTYSTAEYLYSNPDDISKAHVFGYGFSKDEITELPDGSYVYHPTDISTGINSASWQHRLYPGEKLQVQGNFNNKSQKRIKLVLSLFNMPLDSVNISSQQEAEFNLQTLPNHNGRVAYKLSVISEKYTMEQESVPVEIIPSQSLKVLILASSPDFENKFLINWLYQNKNEVALRTTISKDKYDITYLGLSHISLKQITPSLLDNFDVVIADASELQSINSNELAFIQHSIENNQLGLIIRADSMSRKNIFYNDFFRLSFSKNDSSRISYLHIGNDTSLSSISSEPFARIDDKPGMQTLITDARSKIVAGNVLYGFGKIICTTLPNTFSWALSGNKNNYDNVWKLLLQNATKKNAVAFSLNINPAFPRVNEPTEINLQKNDTAMPSAQIENAHISFIQNSFLPSQWKANYWAIKEGWQQYVTDNDTAWFYAFNKNEWKNVYAIEKEEQTKKFIASSKEGVNVHNSEKGLVNKLIPKMLFYFLFVICCIFLWVERKL